MLRRSTSESLDDPILHEPLLRRWWLLTQAMLSGPLETAIQVAERAELFLLSGCTSDHQINNKKIILVPKDHGDSDPPLHLEEHDLSVPVPEENLTNAQKEELKSRLAAGASNSEVATEFGLSLRQVQGFRMQLARKASRMEPPETTDEARSDPKDPVLHPPPSLVEDVVRYLRQQGDVVVKAEPSGFLLNGSGGLTFEQLLHRANRILSRHGKPQFSMPGMPLSDGAQ